MSERGMEGGREGRTEERRGEEKWEEEKRQGVTRAPTYGLKEYQE